MGTILAGCISHRVDGRVGSSRKVSRLGAIVFAWCLAIAAWGQAPTELIRNGDFADGLAGWQNPLSLLWWNPLRDDGRVSLHPPIGDYMGDLIWQPLNVAVSGGEVLNGSIRAEVINAWSADPIVNLVIVYATDGANDLDIHLQSVTTAFFPQPGETTVNFGPIALPEDARRLTEIYLIKVGWGETVVAEVSVTLDGGTVNPVPELTSISKSHGPYGTALTLYGTGFGPSGEVTLTDETAGISVNSWSDTQVTVTIDEPAVSGYLTVWREGLIGSTGIFSFQLDSPSYYITGDEFFQVFEGEELTIGFELAFVNGYTPPAGGIRFRALDGDGVQIAGATFNHPVTAYPGGYVLRIPTAGLPAGQSYDVIVEATEEPLAAGLTDAVSRRYHPEFRLHQAGQCQVRFNDAILEGDSITVTAQNRINLYFAFISSFENWQPMTPVGIATSSNPSVVNAIRRGTPWDYYVFFALQSGTADLTFTGPGGFTRTVHVTVDIPEGNALFTSFSLAPSTVTNIGTGKFVHSVQSTTGITGWGSTPGYCWDNDDPNNAAQLSDSNRQFLRNATVWPLADLGTYYYTVSSSAPGVSSTVGLPLTVTNHASFAGARTFAAPPPGQSMVEGLFDIFGLGQNPAVDEPLYQFQSGIHGTPGLYGAIPPGSYKVRFNSWHGDSTWWGNAPGWAETPPVSFTAGSFFPLDTCPIGRRAWLDTWAVTVGNAAQTLPIIAHRSPPYDEELVVTLDTLPLSAVPGVDFDYPLAAAIHTLTFPIGESSASLPLSILENAEATGPRHLMVALTDTGWVYGAGTPRTTVITIAADEGTTGSVSVTIEPEAARQAGARWRIAGGAWQVSGAVVAGLEAGQITVEFEDVYDWQTPASQTVDITVGATATATGTYTPAANHDVTFDLGAHGTRTGGGALNQVVAHGAAAVEPVFTVEAGWIFNGWSVSFDNVTAALTVTALYSMAPPAAPSNLTATATSKTQVVLAWSDNSNNESSFSVVRRVGMGTWSTVGTPAANATSWQDNGLSPSTEYTYRLFAMNDGGPSVVSNEATATTFPPDPFYWSRYRTSHVPHYIGGIVLDNRGDLWITSPNEYEPSLWHQTGSANLNNLELLTATHLNNDIGAALNVVEKPWLTGPAHAVAVEPDGTAWYGLEGPGLVRELTSGETTLFNFTTTGGKIPDFRIHRIRLFQKLDETWCKVAISALGAAVLDGSDTITQFRTGIVYNNDFINDVFVDSLGRYWVATNRGLERGSGLNLTTHVSVLYPGVANVPPYESPITTIAEDQNGDLWFGNNSYGSNAFYRYKSTQDTWVKYDMTALAGVSNNVTQIAVDSLNNVWFGIAWGGLVRYKNVGGSFTHYTTASFGVQSESVIGVVATPANGLWFATDYNPSIPGNGIGAFQLALDGNGDPTLANAYDFRSDSTTLTALRYFQIAADRAGGVWYPAYGNPGIARRKADGSWEQYYDSATPGVTFTEFGFAGTGVDSAGRVYFHPQNGVPFAYDVATESWLALPTPPEAFFGYSLYVDPHDGKWFCAAYGIYHLDADNTTWTKYTVESTGGGIPSEYADNGAVMDAHGFYWFSTRGGIARFTPAHGDTPDAWTSYKSGDGSGYIGGYKVTLDDNGEAWNVAQQKYDYASNTWTDPADKTSFLNRDLRFANGSVPVTLPLAGAPRPVGSLTQPSPDYMTVDTAGNVHFATFIGDEDAGIVVYHPDVAPNFEPPTLDSASPAPGAPSVPPLAIVSAEFDQAVLAVDLTGVRIESDFASSDVPLTGVSAVMRGGRLLIDHDPFAEGIEYRVTIPAGAIVNLQNEPNAEIQWQFVGGAPNAVSIGDAEFTEGDDSEAEMSFTVTLGSPAELTVTVPWSTANGTALAGSDYQFSSGVVEFEPGETVQTVLVAVIGNEIDEDDETFFVNLGQPVNALAGDLQAVGTILDNDTAAVSIGNATVEEPDAGTVAATFTVTLSTPSAFVVTVDWSTASNSAVAGLDFNGVGNTITFPIGNTSQTVTVYVRGDLIDEADETFFVNLGLPSHGPLGDGQGLGTILDNDTGELEVVDGETIEGGNATVTFTIDLVNSRDVVITWRTIAGTATANSDYTSVIGGTATIPAGELETTVQVVSLQDLFVEPTENLTVEVTNATNIAIGDPTGTVQIEDDDEPLISVGDAAVAEGDSGTTAMVFTVTLDQPGFEPITVDFVTAPGTAAEGTDYTHTTGIVTFPAGWTAQTATVPVVGDEWVEADETFTVTLLNPVSGEILDGLATGTILNDDEPWLGLAIAPGAISENGGTATATVSRNSDPAGPLVVDLASNDESEATVPATVTIPAGERTATFTVSGVDDDLSDGPQTVTVTATAPGHADCTADVIVQDDDNTWTVVYDLRYRQVAYAGGTVRTSELGYLAIDLLTNRVAAIYPGGIVEWWSDADVLVHGTADDGSAFPRYLIEAQQLPLVGGDGFAFTALAGRRFGVVPVGPDQGAMVPTMLTGRRYVGVPGEGSLLVGQFAARFDLATTTAFNTQRTPFDDAVEDLQAELTATAETPVAEVQPAALSTYPLVYRTRALLLSAGDGEQDPEMIKGYLLAVGQELVHIDWRSDRGGRFYRVDYLGDASIAAYVANGGATQIQVYAIQPSALVAADGSLVRMQILTGRTVANTLIGTTRRDAVATRMTGRWHLTDGAGGGIDEAGAAMAYRNTAGAWTATLDTALTKAANDANDDLAALIERVTDKLEDQGYEGTK